MRVLVVEDDASVRETIGIVLEAYQHQVDLAEGGQDALAFLERGTELWPDALLLDLRLKGETGEEVYRQIEARFGKVPPTVVISAAQEGSYRASLLPGVLFLAKPYTVEELLGLLEQVRLVAPSRSKIA
jgi:DNA-binding response OmpR family regulator